MKAKAPKGQWRKTKRCVNGEQRWVKVRTKPDGSEQVKVLHPKKRRGRKKGHKKRK